MRPSQDVESQTAIKVSISAISHLLVPTDAYLQGIEGQRPATTGTLLKPGRVAEPIDGGALGVEQGI